MSVRPCYLVDNTGSVVVPLQRVSGLDAVLSRIRLRLATVRGTWRTNRALGLDVSFIADNRRVSVAEVLLDARSQVEQVPGVLSVTTTVSGDERSAAATMRIVADAGDGATTIVAGLAQPGPYEVGDALSWYILTGVSASPYWSA